VSLAPPREIDRRATERFLRAAIVRQPLATATVASLGVAVCLVVLIAVLAVSLQRVVVERAPLASIVPLLLGGAVAVFVRALLVDVAERQAAEGAADSLASIRAGVLARLFADGNPSAPSPSAAAGATALLDGVDQLEPYYARYLPLLGRAALVSVAYLAIVFPVNWVVGTLLLVATPFIPLNLAAVGLGAEAISRRQVEETHRLAQTVLDRLQGLATLRRLGAAERELAAVAAATDTLRRRTVAVLRVAVLSSAVLEFFGTAAMAVVALYVGLVLLGYVHLGWAPRGYRSEVGCSCCCWPRRTSSRYGLPRRRTTTAPTRSPPRRTCCPRALPPTSLPLRLTGAAVEVGATREHRQRSNCAA
jgi:ATP-binding cassette subfamily C protein CydD